MRYNMSEEDRVSLSMLEVKFLYNTEKMCIYPENDEELCDEYDIPAFYDEEQKFWVDENGEYLNVVECGRKSNETNQWRLLKKYGIIQKRKARLAFSKGDYKVSMKIMSSLEKLREFQRDNMWLFDDNDAMEMFTVEKRRLIEKIHGCWRIQKVMGLAMEVADFYMKWDVIDEDVKAMWEQMEVKLSHRQCNSWIKYLNKTNNIKHLVNLGAKIKSSVSYWMMSNEDRDIVKNTYMHLIKLYNLKEAMKVKEEKKMRKQMENYRRNKEIKIQAMLASIDNIPTYLLK